MEGTEEPKDEWVDRLLDTWMYEWREGGEGEAQVKMKEHLREAGME